MPSRLPASTSDSSSDSSSDPKNTSYTSALNSDITMPIIIRELVQQILHAGIDVIRWDTSLTIQLNVPDLMTRDHTYLISDQHLQRARLIAARQLPEDDETVLYDEIIPYGHSFIYGTEYITYTGLNRPSRLTLLPLSHIGMSAKDLSDISSSSADLLTLPIFTACQAFLHVIEHAKRNSRIHKNAILHLTGIVAYNWFNCDYEGDFLPLPIAPDGSELPLTEDELAEKEEAYAIIRSSNMKPHAKDTLCACISGDIDYHDLGL